MATQQWWNEAIAAADGTAEWRLIGNIARWGEINAVDFNSTLSALEAHNKTINMLLHSGGGSMTEGFQIHGRMQRSPADINTDVEGIAASMGAIIALAGKRRRISRHGRIMIHQGRAGVAGSANKIISEGENLKEMNKTMANIIAEAIHWKHPERDAQWVQDNWMPEGRDTWFSAEKALEEGLVHEVYDSRLADLPAKASFSEAVAFYDSVLVAPRAATPVKPPAKTDKNVQPAPAAPKPQAIKTNTNIMDKSKFILMLAGLGITFGDAVASLEDDAFLDAVKGQLKGLKEKADSAEGLQAKLDSQENEKFEGAVAKAVKAGKITEKQAEHYRKLGEKEGRETVIALLDEMAPAADLEAMLKRKDKKLPGGEDKERENWSWQQWEKNDPKGLIAMADDDPARYQALLAGYETPVGKAVEAEK